MTNFEQQSWRNNRPLHLVILIIAILVSYFGSWNGYFAMGDDYNWTAQMGQRQTLSEAVSGLGNGVRYLNYFQVWLKYQFFGIDATGYLMAGLAQHAIVAILIYFFAESWTQRRFIAFLTALFWATKSSAWEIVSQISASDYSLWAIFWLLTLGFFTLFQQRKRVAYYAASLICYLILVFSHDFSLSIPLVLMAYSLTLGLSNRPITSLRWTDLRVHVPYWILFAIHVTLQFRYIFLGTSEAIYSDASFSPGLHQIWNLVYLGRIIVPNVPVYNYLADVMGTYIYELLNIVTIIVALVGHALALYGLWKGSPLVRFAIALIYLPFLQYTPWGGEFAGVARYLYLPSIGFSILFALLVQRVASYFGEKSATNQFRWAAPTLVVVWLIFNLIPLQFWVQRYVATSQLDKAFVAQITTDFADLPANSSIFIEIPNERYYDLDFSCMLISGKKVTCKSYLPHERSVSDIIAEDHPGPVYVVRATEQGFDWLYPSSGEEAENS